MPADTPAEDITLPSRTYLTPSKTSPALPCLRSRSIQPQLVVARLPAAGPASANSREPVQTDVTHLQLFAASSIQSNRTGLWSSVRVPWPPGTSSTSSCGASAILWSI